MPLSAGPGAGDGLVVAGSSDGDVIALDAADGAERWRAQSGTEVLAAPAVPRGLVLVRTVDGRLLALTPPTARERWVAEQQVPRLSLRGTGRALIGRDLAICGFDNGRVLAVNVADGAVLWEVAVGAAARPHRAPAPDRHRFAPVVIDGDDVFAVGYQGRVARLARDSGQLLVVARPVELPRARHRRGRGLRLDARGRASCACGRRTGVEMWRQDALRVADCRPRRWSATLVVVGDFDGYRALARRGDRRSGRPRPSPAAASASRRTSCGDGLR